MFKTILYAPFQKRNYREAKTWFFVFLAFFVLSAIIFCIAQPTRMFFFIPKPDPLYASDLKNSNGQVFVYVVDSGVDNKAEGMYYHVAKGYNAIKDVPGGNEDCTGHGTSVASVIVDNTDYEDITVVPVKTAECDNTNDPVAIIRGINWIIANHPAGGPVGVINLSFGYVDNIPFLDGIQNAVQSALDAGFIVVASAGNDSKYAEADGVDFVADACASTPSNVPDVITVGAAFEAGFKKAVRSVFSSSGSCVDLFAVGEGVHALSKVDNDFVYRLVQGTSFSAPYVAAAAANRLVVSPASDRFEVESFLKEKAMKGEIEDTDVNPLEPDVPVFPDRLTPNLFLDLEKVEDSQVCVFDLSNFFACR